MKILLYSLIFAPDVCSNAYVFSDLAIELKKLGHEVSVITTTPHYDEKNALTKRSFLSPGKKNWYYKSDYYGVPVYHITVVPHKGGACQRLKTYFRFLHNSIKINRYENLEADIVVSQTPPFFIGIGANNIAKKLKAKSVLIYQDIFVDSMKQKGKLRWPVSSICQYLENKQLKHVDALTTISDDMLEVLKKKKCEKPMFVVPNFVQTSIYHPTSEKFREKYGLDDENFVLSYVGNMGNAQDLSPLLELAKTDKTVKILIAGNGVKEESYKEIVRREKIENIKFLGFISREETCEINSVSDVCMVMLAKHVVATSFPSKTYTLMAMGKPIFVTCGNNSTVGHFIEDNKMGYSCNVENTKEFISIIRTIKNNPKQLQEYGENALRMVHERYSETVVAKAYDDLFKIICKEEL